jgi:regulatory protein
MEQPDEFKKAKDKAYTYLSTRARTRRELTEYLLRKQFTQATAAAVADDLERLKLINDAAYAQDWLELRLKNKPLGKRAAAFELEKRGIGKELVQQVIAAKFEDLDETELAKQILAKRRIAGPLTDEKVKRRLVALLARRGISTQTIFKILRAEE